MNAVNDQGHVWSEFLCSYTSPEGKFSLTIHAISYEHAQLQVDAIRETLTLDGELDGRISAEPPR